MWLNMLAVKYYYNFSCLYGRRNRSVMVTFIPKQGKYFSFIRNDLQNK